MDVLLNREGGSKREGGNKRERESERERDRAQKGRVSGIERGSRRESRRRGSVGCREREKEGLG